MKAILPYINYHQTNIKVYEVITCYVLTNESMIFQSKGKQLVLITKMYQVMILKRPIMTGAEGRIDKYGKLYYDEKTHS